MLPSSLVRRFAWFRSRPLPYQIGTGLVVLLVFIFGAHSLFERQSGQATTSSSNVTYVHLASVAGLSSDTGPLPVTGKVTSISQATILSQTSGEIVSLVRALGDYVNAGDTIAQFENSSQRAAVLQAQGAYDAAQAALAHARGSTTQNAQATSLAALQSAAAALDDAIHIRADVLFTNPRTTSPDFILTVPNSILVQTITSTRATLESTLSSTATLAANAAPITVTRDTATMLAAAQTTLSFLDELIQAVNTTPPNQTISSATLAGYQTSLSAARSEVLGAISTMTGAKSASDSTNLDAAEAAVTTARGTLDAAQALLDKTLVRSPISGTIVSLPITAGDYVGAFSQIAVVSNPHALYIDTQVTPDDARTLSVGATAHIDTSITGSITFIAQAIDPLTNKMAVKVGISGDSSQLTDGEVVSVTLERRHTGAPTPTSGAAIIIPISAVKITPDSPVVFTINNASSTLVAHRVTLGSILGNRITILAGISPDLDIVTDARGLAEGQKVVVK